MPEQRGRRFDKSFWLVAFDVIACVCERNVALMKGNGHDGEFYWR
jgi:hypothetical protein